MGNPEGRAVSEKVSGYRESYKPSEWDAWLMFQFMNVSAYEDISTLRMQSCLTHPKALNAVPE